MLRRSCKNLYLLQKTPQKEEGDSILPLALDWYCDAPGETVRRDDSVNVNPGVRFDLTLGVVNVPARDDIDLQPDASIDHDASDDSLPSYSELLNALDLVGNNLPDSTSLDVLIVSTKA